MTTQDHDTDPSTPGAKRLSDPRAPAAVAVEDVDPALDDASSTLDEAAALAAEVPSDPDHAAAAEVDVRSAPRRVGPNQRLSRPTTDPGIAPPPTPLPVPEHPMGIVVPSVVPRAPDAVDVLLEGISREPSERRTTPQTDGQRVAKYHAKHNIRAARGAVDEEPKVVIARQLLAQTVRVATSKVSAPDADPRAWAETTAAKSQSLAGRVFVAVVAGLVVVTVIFVALRRTSSERPAEAAGVSVAGSAAIPAAAPAASESVAPAPLPRDTAPPPATSAVSADPQPSAAPIAAANSLTRKAAPVWKPNKPKAKPLSSAAKPAGVDLGEFKAAF